MPKTSAQKELEKHWAKQAKDAQKRQQKTQPPGQETKPGEPQKPKARSK